jgi:polyphosphate kinase
MKAKPKPKKSQKKKVVIDLKASLKDGGKNILDDPRLFINREISWVRFNTRVLEEAKDDTHPLLERVKFLAICGSNLDEFFMIRVSGLKRQLNKGALEPPPDGMTPLEQLLALREELKPLLDQHLKCWQDDVLPKLKKNGVHIHRMDELTMDERGQLREYFEKVIFPTLTPLALDLVHPFPFISNLSINLAVVVRDNNGHERYARVKVPNGLFPRLIEFDDDTDKSGKGVHFVFLEDLVASNLDLLFPGMKVEESYVFRITRDADIEIELDEAEDLLTAVEEGVESRRVGAPTRLEVDGTMPVHLRDLFASKLGLPPYLVYQTPPPLGFVDLWQLVGLPRQDLKDIPFLPFLPPALQNEKKIFSAIKERDFALYHPYDSFVPVVNLLKEAAVDPEVLAIKITLYRVDRHSPIIEALMEARDNGKAVAATVELKARFDEENNIEWARALETKGVHVVYGLADLKVHAKLCLIIRKEKSGIVRYSHISSGNYNTNTARVYADIGYLTADHDIGSDVSDLFNSLTGYSQKEDYRKLLVSPVSMRREIIRRIDREIQRHQDKGDGYIGWKLNALVDKQVIQALYRASMAGVKIDLNVRGQCCLRPGIKGVSENIRVTSILGRFLEHARIYYFRNGGEGEVLLGSSDMMPRNLQKRVEVLFPVGDKKLRNAIVKDILEVHLADNVKARQLMPDGSYRRVQPEKGEKKMSSQLWMIKHRGKWHGGS